MVCEYCGEGEYVNTNEEVNKIISGKENLCEIWECSNCNHQRYNIITNCIMKYRNV